MALPESYNYIHKSGTLHEAPSPIIPLNWSKASMTLMLKEMSNLIMMREINSFHNEAVPIKRTAQREIVREVKVINKLLLAYLIGLVVTSTLIFIFSEEKVTYRLFAAVITGLTWPLSLIPSIISLMIRKSD